SAPRWRRWSCSRVVLLIGLVLQTPLLALFLRSEGGHLSLAAASLAVGLVPAVAAATQARPGAALLLLALAPARGTGQTGRSGRGPRLDQLDEDTAGVLGVHEVHQ